MKASECGVTVLGCEDDLHTSRAPEACVLKLGLVAGGERSVD